MVSLSDFTDIVATAFFDGNLGIAGIVIYACVLMAIFALTRNTMQTLIVTIPVTLAFSFLGVLNTDLMILLLIVTVLALALNTSKSITRS